MGRPARAAIAFAGMVCLLTPAAPAPAAPNGNLGTNLANITYYDGAMIFADIVEQASDWVPQQQGADWGGGPPLQLRPDGWPAQLGNGQYGSLVLADNTYPAGGYAVSWRGSGTFSISGQTFSGRNGSGQVQLDGSSMVVLDLRATDPGDPLRDIAVRAPGTEPGARFHPDYLRQLAPYGVLRFMDWQRTNSTFADPDRTFTCATRVPGDHYSQGTIMGASVEAMVDLANTTGKDPWFTIPHEATPDWITCHAQVVAERLEPGLVPRYEFSNETWNPAFRAFHDLGGGADFEALQVTVAQRHIAAMDAVGQVMDTAGRPYIRVLAGQAANAWVLERRLDTPGAMTRTDEIAIAPYLGVGGNPFDPAQAAGLAGMTRDQLRSRLQANQIDEVDSWVADHVALARRTGKPLVAYEGGQHLAGDPNNNALTSLFTGFNRTDAMGQLYDTYLDRWREATGNALLVHFTDIGPYSRYGSWGAVESGTTDLQSSPKYRALAAYAGTAIPEPAPTPVPTPTVTSEPEAAKIVLAGGRAFTNKRRVGVDVTWPTGATSVTLSDSPDFSGARSFGRDQRIIWRLPAEGPATVHARFAGGSSATASDRIVVDLQAPAVKRVRVTRIEPGRLRVRSMVRDRYSGVAQVQISARRGGGQVFTEHVRDVRVTGATVIFVRFADRAGNRTRWQRAPVSPGERIR